ncbi:MAG: hypothetical protein Q9162_003783 [Coniocarpon cinnabarinum]
MSPRFSFLSLLSFFLTLFLARESQALTLTSTKSLHSFHPPGRFAITANPLQNSTFQQNIDHNATDLGTFSQFYYFNDEFWAPGGPVVLFTPGEVDAVGYGSYATVIVLEHRYWGMSSPYPELTTSNLRYLTLQNSITDLTHFAETADLPFDPLGSSKPDKAPWILMGASYSGALAAWTAAKAPGTFWAYIASSAPVEAVYDYWGYFEPVQLGMPANCSKDVSLVIDHIDDVFENGTAADQEGLKEMFGLGGLEHNDDFGAALEWAPWLWQSNQFYVDGGFSEWCDAVEGVSNSTTADEIPGAEGVGLGTALAGYASWMNETLLPDFCASSYVYTNDSTDISCFDTYNTSNPLFTDKTLQNTADRQWQCAPDGFTFGYDRGLTEDDENAYTGGWDITNTTRLIYTNGEYDPWRTAGVSSDLRPAGPLASTEQVPVNVVPGGFHGSDMVTRNGDVNVGAKAVIDKEVQQIVDWVAEFTPTS